jgi:hypothetical protein
MARNDGAFKELGPSQRAPSRPARRVRVRPSLGELLGELLGERHAPSRLSAVGEMARAFARMPATEERPKDASSSKYPSGSFGSHRSLSRRSRTSPTYELLHGKRAAAISVCSPEI